MTAVGHARQTFTREETRITIVGVMLVFLLGALDQTIVSTAMPRIVAQLKGLNLYAWVTTAYMLSSTVMVPIYGKLNDIFGRKPILITGIVIFVSGSALCGLSGEFGSLPLLGGGMPLLPYVNFEPARTDVVQGIVLRLVAFGGVHTGGASPPRAAAAQSPAAPLAAADASAPPAAGGVFVAGVVELPLYTAGVGVEGVMTLFSPHRPQASHDRGAEARASNDGDGNDDDGDAPAVQVRVGYRLAVREAELLWGDSEQGWETRFGGGHPHWEAGLTHVFTGEMDLPVARWEDWLGGRAGDTWDAAVPSLSGGGRWRRRCPR